MIELFHTVSEDCSRIVTREVQYFFCVCYPVVA